jgi:hypothetical protein
MLCFTLFVWTASSLFEMVAGLRPNDPHATSSVTPKAKGTPARTSTHTAFKIVNGVVRVSAVKSVSAARRDSFKAICDEGLAELIQFLIVHPERILVMLRMARGGSYFRMKQITYEQWMRSTLVYMAGVPKKI